MKHPLSITMLACFALAAGAGSCQAETTGEEILFEAAVSGATSDQRAPSEEFTTYAGWSVRLTRALTAVGPLYYYAGEPQASLLERVFGLRAAHACPSHAQYNKGAVLGEIVQQVAVDLLGPTTRFAELPGVAGTCQSIELHLHPPGKLAAGTSSIPLSELQGHTFLIEGEASQDTRVVPFRAHGSLPEEGLMQVVESIPAAVALRDTAEKPGYILLEVLVDQWFAMVDFGTLTEQQGGAFVFTDATQAWTALVRGIRSRQSYRVSWRSS